MLELIAGILGIVTGVWFLVEKAIPYLREKNFVLGKRADKPNTQSINQKLLRKVFGFLNQGDIASSKAILLDGVNFNDAPPKIQLEIIIIEQKYGQLDKALEHIDIAKNNLNEHSIELKIQLNLTLFKIHNQLGDMGYITSNYNQMLMDLDLINNEQKKPSILNRVAVAFACQSDIYQSWFFLKESIEISNRFNLKHTKITTEMFMIILQEFRGVKCEIKNTIQSIKKCQLDYISTPLGQDNLDLWQADNLKSIVQCIFCEAAIFFNHGDERLGLLRLVAASLLTQYVKSNIHMEGYADLINVINNDKIKEKIKEALLLDDDARSEFYSKNSISVTFLSDLQKFITPTYKILEQDGWLQFREYLDKYE